MRDLPVSIRLLLVLLTATLIAVVWALAALLPEIFR